MVHTIEGQVRGEAVRVAIAVSRWNALVTERLLLGAVDTLRRYGVGEGAVTVVWCPGSFELPLLVQELAQTGQYDAVIALGAVIRGETPHFEYIATQVAAGIARVGLQTRVPCIFGVLTTDTLEQALERAGGKVGNKGVEAALAALEMVNLLRQLRQ
ncbi:MAG: 6,7-dimethyl-8-ribityllumazine synthase [Candidatus Kapabacteria bacterium]|nr:6,7-dimethyl-8-ribityllumazine synthase [Candidatus Kapabacteria bacterium]MCS7170137.1 6,7-dimethyl-8-ribityllumazine synthase [Candidatus Kapabacteria bacterium]MDW7996567.1 6,7-dimethyl-8-ribityllumazine synthase [Bacteroidota bacterium]MDW8224759.1 6,7-dimethyl-8-ribityllumazine synthase [Bacteroidota bacterium]